MSMNVNTSRLIYDNSNYATMRFEPESLHGANNGLHVARGLMEQVKKEFEWISYGDLWTLAGVAAIQVGDRVYIWED
jgi:catalase (peroxidase I)